jgi:hypothetical protein
MYVNWGTEFHEFETFVRPDAAVVVPYRLGIHQYSNRITDTEEKLYDDWQTAIRATLRFIRTSLYYQDGILRFDDENIQEHTWIRDLILSR